METKVRMNISEVPAKKRQELQDLLEERARWGRVQKEAEEMTKVCTTAIVPLMAEVGADSVDAPDGEGRYYRFSRVNGSNSSLDRQALLMKGIDPGILEECTKVTKFTTIQMKEIVVT